MEWMKKEGRKKRGEVKDLEEKSRRGQWRRWKCWKGSKEAMI